MELYVCGKNAAKKGIFSVLILVVLPVLVGGCMSLQGRATRDYTQARVRSAPLIVPSGFTWTKEPVTPLVVASVVDARQQAQAKPLITLPLVNLLPSVRPQSHDMSRSTDALCLQIVDDAKLAYLKIPGWRDLDVFYELVERLSAAQGWRMVEQDERHRRITVALSSSGSHPGMDFYVLSVENKHGSTRVVVLNGQHDPYDAKKARHILHVLAQLIGKSCASV